MKKQILMSINISIELAASIRDAAALMDNTIIRIKAEEQLQHLLFIQSELKQLLK